MLASQQPGYHAEKQRQYRARQKLKLGRPMTNNERVAAHRLRQKEAATSLPENSTDKHQRFAELIAQAQALAIEINAEMMADLETKPVTRETARRMDALEKAMRFSFHQIYIPT